MLSKLVFMGNGMFGTQSHVVWYTITCSLVCILSMCLVIFGVHVVIAVCIIY